MELDQPVPVISSEQLPIDNHSVSSLSIDVSAGVSKQQQPNSLEIKVDNSPNLTLKLATPPIDLISTTSQEDLPHVDGHEMEQYLAGIESESSLHSNPEGSVAGGNSRGPSGNPSGNPLDMFAHHQHPHPHHRHHSLLQPSFDPMNELPKQQHTIMQMTSPPIMSPTGPGIDPFKFGTHFADDKDPSESTAPIKIDAQTQKQLKKWEQDEKLGELATISPVLFANMIHQEELDTKYKGIMFSLFV